MIILRILNSPYANDLTRNAVLSHQDVDNNFIYLKGHIIYEAENNGGLVTLKKYNGETITFSAATSGGSTFTGGTVNGQTIFTNGLTTTTVSATTYFNLPKDVFTTGGTYNSSNGTTTFINNTGGTFNVTGYFKTSDDIYTTGMTFNPSNYDLIISRNDNTNFTQNLSLNINFNLSSIPESLIFFSSSSINLSKSIPNFNKLALNSLNAV